jgi:hypothetical protein
MSGASLAEDGDRVNGTGDVTAAGGAGAARGGGATGIPAGAKSVRPGDAGKGGGIAVAAAGKDGGALGDIISVRARNADGGDGITGAGGRDGRAAPLAMDSTGAGRPGGAAGGSTGLAAGISIPPKGMVGLRNPAGPADCESDAPRASGSWPLAPAGASADTERKSALA